MALNWGKKVAQQRESHGEPRRDPHRSPRDPRDSQDDMSMDEILASIRKYVVHDIPSPQGKAEGPPSELQARLENRLPPAFDLSDIPSLEEDDGSDVIVLGAPPSPPSERASASRNRGRGLFQNRFRPQPSPSLAVEPPPLRTRDHFEEEQNPRSHFRGNLKQDFREDFFAEEDEFLASPPLETPLEMPLSTQAFVPAATIGPVETAPEAMPEPLPVIGSQKALPMTEAPAPFQTTVSEAFARLSALTEAPSPSLVDSVSSNLPVTEFMHVLLKPLLQEWLERHLPGLVEKMVADEIAKIRQR